MGHIRANEMTDEALIGYDRMMIECIPKIDKWSGLATLVWRDVLTELDKRGKVKIASGSYDDLGNALIQRLY